jgi:hypothetical protein
MTVFAVVSQQTRWCLMAQATSEARMVSWLLPETGPRNQVAKMHHGSKKAEILTQSNEYSIPSWYLPGTS